jgi:hypothetical protein
MPPDPPKPPGKKRDYEVGYGKPPRHTRFKKGQSGNPRGRAAGAKNLKTLLIQALNELVIVSDNGGHRKITKREAIVTQLVNRSATADFRAIKILVDLVGDIEGHTEPASPETAALVLLPDNNRDPELTEELRKALAKYFVKKQQK